MSLVTFGLGNPSAGLCAFGLGSRASTIVDVRACLSIAVAAVATVGIIMASTACVSIATVATADAEINAAEVSTCAVDSSPVADASISFAEVATCSVVVERCCE